MKSFRSRIAKLGINPYVGLPEDVLEGLFRQAGRTKGPIPVRGTLNGKLFTQSVVKYQGAWRLYLNTQMRRDAGIDVGDSAHVSLTFDPKPRIVPMHPVLARALARNSEARAAFARLAPSRRKEILRYLASMKTEVSLVRNVEKVVRHLVGMPVQGLRTVTRAPKR